MRYSFALSGVLTIVVLHAAPLRACAQQPAPRSLGHQALTDAQSVRDGETFETWRRVHPADSVELFQPQLRVESQSGWCVRSIAHIALDSNRTARRVAYFYAPPLDSTTPFPGARTPESLRAQCRLGLVWFNAIERDSVRGERLLEQARSAIAARNGPPDTITRLVWNNGAAWRGKHLWHADRIDVVTAISNRPNDEAETAPRRPHVMVAITGRASRVTLLWDVAVAYTRKCSSPTTPRCENFARIDEALSLAAIGGALEREMRAVAARFEDSATSETRFTPPERRAYVAMLQRWIAETRPLPAARRAAGLLAADLLLESKEYITNVSDLDSADAKAMRAQLASAGAHFEEVHLANGWLYRRSWLKEALALESGARAHDLAFLTMMERGFETSSCTDQKGEGFRAVINRGADYLRRNTANSIARQIHHMMARAYGDIVALANGAAYQPEDTARYVGEAAAARAKALEHYAIAYADRALPAHVRQDILSSAWRLAAGLAPLRTYFYCVYD